MLHRVIGLGLGGRVCFIFLRPLKRCSFLHTWATYQQQQLPNVSCNRKLFSAAKSPLASSTKVPSIHHVDGRTQGWLDMRDALIRSNRVKYTIASPRMGQDLKKSKEERVSRDGHKVHLFRCTNYHHFLILHNNNINLKRIFCNSFEKWHGRKLRTSRIH